MAMSCFVSLLFVSCELLSGTINQWSMILSHAHECNLDAILSQPDRSPMIFWQEYNTCYNLFVVVRAAAVERTIATVCTVVQVVQVRKRGEKVGVDDVTQVVTTRFNNQA